MLILTGGPGTGKTTTLNAIIDLLEDEGLSIAIAAPTGRAAKRVSEVTGRDAKTIHRLLEVDFGLLRGDHLRPQRTAPFKSRRRCHRRDVDGGHHPL